MLVQIRRLDDEGRPRDVLSDRTVWEGEHATASRFRDRVLDPMIDEAARRVGSDDPDLERCAICATMADGEALQLLIPLSSGTEAAARRLARLLGAEDDLDGPRLLGAVRDGTHALAPHPIDDREALWAVLAGLFDASKRGRQAEASFYAEQPAGGPPRFLCRFDQDDARRIVAGDMKLRIMTTAEREGLRLA